MLKEIAESEGNIVLFIDEIHLVLGAGRSSDGAMDAANLLKPLLVSTCMDALAKLNVNILRLNQFRMLLIVKEFETILLESTSMCAQVKL